MCGLQVRKPYTAAASPSGGLGGRGAGHPPRVGPAGCRWQVPAKERGCWPLPPRTAAVAIRAQGGAGGRGAAQGTSGDAADAAERMAVAKSHRAFEQYVIDIMQNV